MFISPSAVGRYLIPRASCRRIRIFYCNAPRFRFHQQQRNSTNGSVFGYQRGSGDDRTSGNPQAKSRLSYRGFAQKRVCLLGYAFSVSTFRCAPPTMRNQLGESSYRDRRGMHSTEIGIVRPALFGSSVRWRPGRSMVNFYTQETAKTCEYSYALSTLSFGR